MIRNISVIILILLLTSCKKEAPIIVQNGTLYNNINIISANEEKVDSFLGFVLLDGNKIVYVNKKQPRISGNCKKIDAKGKFIISGLIDSHVHLANTSGFNAQLNKKYPKLLDAYFEQLPRSYLYYGFTTLVDVNNYAPHIIDQINKRPFHPDIFTCGSQVQIMNDFNMEMEEYSLMDRYNFPFLYDEYNKNIHFPDSIDLSQHTPEKIIYNIKNQKGIGVKIAYEDEASGLMVSWAKPSKEILSDLASEAHKEKMPVLIHAPSLEGHQIAIEGGVDIFAHGLWNWTDNFEQEFLNLDLTPQQKEVLLQIAQKKLGYQLTFRTITGEEDLIAGNFTTDQNIKHVYSTAFLDILHSEEGDWGRNKILARGAFLKKTNPAFYNAMRGDYTSDEQMWTEVYVLYKERLDRVAKFLSDNNANFILGSDTPAMNMLTNPPGYNGFLEMKHMFEAGISLEKIFRAATYNNAKAFHLEALYGGVEKGKIANLLILGSDPLHSVNAYNDIEMVVIGGKMIAREKLSATNNVSFEKK